jgi:iron complex transport system substrate-binding protein
MAGAGCGAPVFVFRSATVGKWFCVAAVFVLGCRAWDGGGEGAGLRVVSLAPAITEILFAAGAGDGVVGVTTYCSYPQEVGKIEKVGDFATLDFEKIVRLKPDLVVATEDGNPRQVVEKLQSLGIRTLVVNGRSFADVISSIFAIGDACGVKGKASALARELEARWARAGRRRGGEPRPATLLLYGIDPLVAAGKGSLGDELITQAGGRNVFGGSEISYVTTEHEQVISLAPEVIVQVAMGTEADRKVHEFWGRWTAIPAVRDGRVYVLDPDLVTRPGPRIIEGLTLLEKVLHERGGKADR